MFILFRKGNRMKKGLLAISISLSLLSMSGVAQAEASIKLGKGKSAACAGCHGETGNSLVSMYPKLASQNEEYIIKQLHAFKDGSRNGPMMSAMVSGLGKADIQDLAAYYESQDVSENSLPVIELDDDDDDDMEEGAELTEEQQLALNEKKQAAEAQQLAQLTLGHDLYLNGHLESEISACIACHGPQGEGNKPAAFPALNGQHNDYLAKTLQDFKAGKRTNDEQNMMRMIAKRMSDKEIKAVSLYISTMK